MSVIKSYIDIYIYIYKQKFKFRIKERLQKEKKNYLIFPKNKLKIVKRRKKLYNTHIILHSFFQSSPMSV